MELNIGVSAVWKLIAFKLRKPFFVSVGTDPKLKSVNDFYCFRQKNFFSSV